MAINFITGLPREGKTLWTICYVKELAEKENRQVYTCNIPGVTISGWETLEHPDNWMDIPDGAIIIVDELQDFWQKAPSGSRVPIPILELSKHGKRGIDFYFITQEPDLVHTTPRSLCQHHYYVVRHMGVESASIYKFQRMQLHPEKVKKQAEKFLWKYNKDAYGWYKSANVHNVKVALPLKLIAIPIGVVFFFGAIYVAYLVFSKFMFKDEAKKLSSANSTNVAQSVSGTAFTQKQAQLTKVLSAELSKTEYLDQFKPRIENLPWTAPRYDTITVPVRAPIITGCMMYQSSSEGSELHAYCFTQQGTKIKPPVEFVKRFIANRGIFYDFEPDSLVASNSDQVVQRPAHTSYNQNQLPID